MPALNGPGPPPHEEMLRLQKSIPENERCKECAGMGWLDVGHVPRKTYAPCLECFRRGRKNESIPEIRKKEEGAK